jgi:UDP-3-O-[3-hydroxymyristoyl] N-acetylglucosamine deacetylase
MSEQRTLRKAISISGIGLHSGKPATITLRPGLPNQGIVFFRSDLSGKVGAPNSAHSQQSMAEGIAAHFRNVVNTQLATTLGRGRITISTVEHVLAALQGMGIDNAVCEVDGPEIPILDGSSIQFCDAITQAGIRVQDAFQPFIRLRRKVEVKVGEKWALAEPCDRLEIHASVEWDHPSIVYQTFHYADDETSFAEELAAARTFCMLKDVETMKKMGLALGGSLENAVVLDQTSVLNPGGFRFPDEIVRHKVLDALGDLKLAGMPIQASIRLHRAGHDLHSQLLSAIFADRSNYEVIDASGAEEEAPAGLLKSLVAASAV